MVCGSKFIVDRLAHIIEHMHSHNVVHTDLKPHNFVLFGLKWKIIDFECARRVGEPVGDLVSTAYMSPEMARALLMKQPDRIRALTSMDMWSFGLMFYELFSTTPYFAEKANTLQQLASYAELEISSEIVTDI